MIASSAADSRAGLGQVINKLTRPTLAYLQRERGSPARYKEVFLLLAPFQFLCESWRYPFGVSFIFPYREAVTSR